MNFAPNHQPRQRVFTKEVTFDTSATSEVIDTRGFAIVGFQTGTMVGTTLSFEAGVDPASMVEYRTIDGDTSKLGAVTVTSDKFYSLIDFFSLAPVPYLRLVSSSSSETGTVTLVGMTYL